MLEYGAKIHYFLTLVCVEALRQFDTLSAEVGSATPENLISIILGFCTYFFPINVLSNQKHVISHKISRPCGLKLRRYAPNLIGLK